MLLHGFGRHVNNALRNDLAEKDANDKPGERCPQDGWWYTPAQGSRRYFKQGDVFPTINGDWGDTFWIWAVDQTPPTMG